MRFEDMNDVWPFIAAACSLLFAPLLPGVINRVKAWFAGRRGQPIFQTYFDIWKLLRKGAVYSRTTTWIFRLMPVVALAVTFLGTAIMPFGGKALVSFEGDIILLAYLFGLMRFMMVIAALDTGSSFEGMGASREVTFAVLTEPALFIGFASLALVTGSISLSEIFGAISVDVWHAAGLAFVLVAVAFLIVALAENCRIPFDDPNTHLELTMIHEVMVLDHSGPDLAFIQYASALKLWILGALAVNIFVPLAHLTGPAAIALFISGMMIFAVLVGIVESVMARLGLVKVPNVLAGATAISILAFALVMRFTL